MNNYDLQFYMDVIIISPVPEGSGDIMVLCRSRPPQATRHPPPGHRDGVNVPPKNTGWVVLKFGTHIDCDNALT